MTWQLAIGREFKSVSQWEVELAVRYDSAGLVQWFGGSVRLPSVKRDRFKGRQGRERRRDRNSDRDIETARQ